MRKPHNPTLRSVLNKYHTCDARRIMEHLPKKKFVDLTLTSPPYWNLKDYGSPNQIGFSQTYESYLADLKSVFRGVYEITKPTGSLWIVADTIKHAGELKLLPFDLAAHLKEIGWVLHDIIIWNKDKSLPWSHRGKLRNIFEYILFFSKTADFKYRLGRVREIDGLKAWWVRYPERYSPEGKAPPRTWSIPIPRQGSWGENWVRHFCPLPPDLVRRIVLLTTDRGDVVLDPFSGSGVVLAQAATLHRKYVGLDLSPAYRKMFHRKVLPSIHRLERERYESKTKRGRRALFKRAIWTLRKLKFPRELQRLYEDSGRNLHLTSIIARSPSQRSLELLLVRKKRMNGSLLRDLRALVGRPPLSKYGLKVKLSVSARLPTRRGPRTRLYLYENGNTVDFARTGKILDLLHNGRGKAMPCRFAPIVSNMKMDRASLDPRQNGKG